MADRMETPSTSVETIGVGFLEMHTIRFHVPTSKLREQYKESQNRTQMIRRVSFNQGLLAAFSIELLITFEDEKTETQVFYAPTLKNHKDNQIAITGMKMTSLTNNAFKYSVEMSDGEINGSQGFAGRTTNYRTHFSSTVQPNHTNKWPDSVDELRIDISVCQLTKVKVKFSETASTSPAANPSIQTGFIDIGKFYLSPEFSDVSIRCGSQTFPAHLFVLSQNSPTFAKTFEHNMKESQEKAVEIKDADSSAVREMLRYIYTGKVDNLDVMGIKIYELADRYLNDGLRAVCANYLATHVDAENMLELYCFGKQHDIPILTNAAKLVLDDNRENLIKHVNDLNAFINTVPPPLQDEVFKLLWTRRGINN